MQKVARMWGMIQARLMPFLEEHLDEPLTEKHRQLCAALEVVRIEEHVPSGGTQRLGRRRLDRRRIARAFVAKAVYGLPTTDALLEMLLTDGNLHRICGWEHRAEVPSASTFSRAFGEFANSKLCDRVHEGLVKEHLADQLVGHISRDSTEIKAREKPAKKAPKPEAPRRRPGRPRNGEVVEKPQKRLETQVGQTAQEALAELPTACDIGMKRDTKGYGHHWVGYKTHLDVNDAGIPITVVTTSASLHDSQVAIPMEKLTATRVTSLYALMDSAYDAALIKQVCRSLQHVPIIDSNPRSGSKVPFEPPTAQRYKGRTTVERAYGRLKDQFGARQVRVRGHSKVHAHVMFGVLALFADQLLKLVM